MIRYGVRLLCIPSAGVVDDRRSHDRGGAGFRAFVFTAVLEFVVVLVVCLLNLSAMIEALEHWQTDGLMILPFLALWVFPVTMGVIILYAKWEERDRFEKVCRVCGYDLRESPVRCPECGTLVREDSERF